MVHLPLVFHDGPPQSALIICFGMGTSYRSALSWGLDTTAVELVPDVPRAFGFYHADAAQYLNNPKGRIIVDDGRRFLMRTRGKYDVIVIDPPPPPEAAGSSLLYSTEFYLLAKQHLNTNGILQMWFPGGEELTGQAVIRSLYESFPYVRGFPSVKGWGIHLLASMQPMAQMDAHQLAARMPAAAKKDLLEWDDSTNAAAYLAGVTTKEYSVPNNLNPDLSIKVTDDQPFNEYFLLRHLNGSAMRYTY
jgi:spermidine synthase